MITVYKTQERDNFLIRRCLNLQLINFYAHSSPVPCEAQSSKKRNDLERAKD